MTVTGRDRDDRCSQERVRRFTIRFCVVHRDGDRSTCDACRTVETESAVAFNEDRNVRVCVGWKCRCGAWVAGAGDACGDVGGCGVGFRGWSAHRVFV